MQREQVPIFELGSTKMQEALCCCTSGSFVFLPATDSRTQQELNPRLRAAPSRLSSGGSRTRAPMPAPRLLSWILRRHRRAALRGLLEKAVLCRHLQLKSMVSSLLMSHILIFTSNDHSRHQMLHSGKIINWFIGKCKLKASFHTKTQFSN